MWLCALATFATGRPDVRSVEGSPDRQTLERLARGDGDALRELYDHYARPVYSLAARILRDQSDAEDVVQEVFAQAWRQASRYDAARGSVAGWLLMQARSRAIDRLRGRQARPEQTGVDAAEVAGADPGALPDAQAVTGEQVGRVRQALGELPLVQRTAIELAYYEGLTHTEIADRLELPLGTVKTRIRQGLLKLRDAFDVA